MKFIGLDNKEYKISFTKYKPKNTCSSLHLRARILLNKEFPYDIIYEEVPLPGTKSERQTRLSIVDFFIPSRQIIVEVQGEQHYKFNDFFYNNKIEFFKAQSRDRSKHKWCEINKLILIEFPFNETDNEWANRVRNRL